MAYKDKEKEKAYNRRYEEKRRKTLNNIEYQKKYQKEWRLANPEYQRKNYKKYDRKKYREYIYKYHKEYSKNNPLKVSAWKKFNIALSLGKIIKSDRCCFCDREAKMYAHHHDYLKPLDIIWLCGSCHRKLHCDMKKQSAIDDH